MHYTQQAI